MGKNRKLVNNTNIPQDAIECFTRCIFDDVIAAYHNTDIQNEFAAWQAEQAKKRNIESCQHRSSRCFYLVLSFDFLRLRKPLG